LGREERWLTSLALRTAGFHSSPTRVWEEIAMFAYMIEIRVGTEWVIMHEPIESERAIEIWVRHLANGDEARLTAVKAA
jgi:hypothetical protein